ncbi:MAG: PHP domain-containing protein [Chloroflexia bacterium]|nr:PHP domain-containing protein [Chloroflexia bacterium]
MKLYGYPGALHIHSSYSDGTAKIPRIAKAARDAGLSWILISDHDTLAGLENREAGWYDGTAVMVGYEVTPPDSHYLVAGLEELLPPSLPSGELVEAVREKGGRGFVLHPDEKAGSYFKPPFPWKDRSVRGFDGIEIWNYMSQWTEGITERNRYARFLCPLLAVKGPSRDVLDWWDELLAEGERVSAIGGLDVHGTIHQLWGRFPLQVFPYRRQFGTIVNHIVLRRPLSQRWSEACGQILDSLAEGHSYLAYEALGKARGFRFLAERDGQQWTLGEEVPAGGPVRLGVHCPRWARIHIVYNGRTLRRTWGQILQSEVQQPGAYRVEAYRFGRPWLYSNPIYLAKRELSPPERRRYTPPARKPWE